MDTNRERPTAAQAPTTLQALYNETNNRHPRGFIGMLIANSLILRGWHEEKRGYYNEIWWIDPDGLEVGSLEFAQQREFGHRL